MLNAAHFDDKTNAFYFDDNGKNEKVIRLDEKQKKCFLAYFAAEILCKLDVINDEFNAFELGKEYVSKMPLSAVIGLINIIRQDNKADYVDYWEVVKVLSIINIK